VEKNGRLFSNNEFWDIFIKNMEIFGEVRKKSYLCNQRKHVNPTVFEISRDLHPLPNTEYNV
jgi:hypothetical protein